MKQVISGAIASMAKPKGDQVMLIIQGSTGVGAVSLAVAGGGLNKTVMSDASGNYEFGVPHGWTGTVTATKTGYTMSAAKTYTAITESYLDEDFEATVITYTISGNVGVAGVTLTYTDGTEKTVESTTGGDYTLTVSYNWSGTVVPTLENYTFDPVETVYTNVLADQTDQDYEETLTLSAVVYDFSDYEDGPLPDGLTGDTWAIDSGVAINTPVGDELVTNGSMDDWSDGLPVGFTMYGSPSPVISEVAPTEGYGGTGTGAANIYASSSADGLRTATFTAAVSKWLRLAFSLTKHVTGNLSAHIGADVIYNTEGDKVQTHSGGSTFAGLLSSGGAADITLDDVSVKHIELSELSALIEGAQTDMRVSTDVLRNAYAWQGGLAIVDSPTNPQNGLIMYLNVPTSGGTKKLVVDKYLAGVRTNVLDVNNSIANLAHKHSLIFQKVSGKYYIRCINRELGCYTERTNTSIEITDEAILACQYFGLFSPDQNITFDNLALYPNEYVHNTYWVGDSKMTQFYNNCPFYFTDDSNVFEEAPERQATSGGLMADVKASIDTSIAAAVETPELCFFNVGVNDANAEPVTDETQFKADMQYILDAIHTAWADIPIYIMSGVYRTSKPIECATVSGWIKTVLANNPTFCYEWADELVWYAADMGTYSRDEVHYTVAGCQEAARLGRIAAGY